MDDTVKRYSVIFSGHVLPGYTFDKVKEEVSQTLNLSSTASERLFQRQNRPVVIKRLDSIEKANTYCRKLNRFGMALDIKENLKAAESKIITAPKLEITCVPEVLPPKTVVEKSVVHKVYETVQVAEVKPTLFESILDLKQPLLLLLIGFCFCIIYLPYPDGFLLKGFVLGSVLMILGYKNLRSRI